MGILRAISACQRKISFKLPTVQLVVKSPKIGSFGYQNRGWEPKTYNTSKSGKRGVYNPHIKVPTEMLLVSAKGPKPLYYGHTWCYFTCSMVK